MNVILSKRHSPPFSFWKEHLTLYLFAVWSLKLPKNCRLSTSSGFKIWTYIFSVAVEGAEPPSQRVKSRLEMNHPNMIKFCCDTRGSQSIMFSPILKVELHPVLRHSHLSWTNDLWTQMVFLMTPSGDHAPTVTGLMWHPVVPNWFDFVVKIPNPVYLSHLDLSHIWNFHKLKSMIL